MQRFFTIAVARNALMKGHYSATLDNLYGSIQLADWLVKDSDASSYIDRTSSWISVYAQSCVSAALSTSVNSDEQLDIKVRMLARHLCSAESLSDEAISAFADMVTYITRKQ